MTARAAFAMSHDGNVTGRSRTRASIALHIQLAQELALRQARERMGGEKRSRKVARSLVFRMAGETTP